MTATTTTPYVSVHDQRVRMVADVLTARSGMAEESAMEAAVHVVYALDHRPEAVRYSG